MDQELILDPSFYSFPVRFYAIKNNPLASVTKIAIKAV